MNIRDNNIYIIINYIKNIILNMRQMTMKKHYIHFLKIMVY